MRYGEPRRVWTSLIAVRVAADSLDHPEQVFPFTLRNTSSRNTANSAATFARSLCSTLIPARQLAPLDPCSASKRLVTDGGLVLLLMPNPVTRGGLL
jgi:hypothetical protein